ncbi:MAG: TRAP transporter small permease subunit [Oscillatoria sp. SIO1A7]|nr:TRAP transporter small permease subunit [Oscillatoria sp. SIO1A7]
MQKLLAISRIIDAFNDRIGRFASWLVLLMAVVGVWNVVGRYLGRAVGQNLTSNALIEAQWQIFDIIFLLGAGYALSKDAHVRVDVFYSNWSKKWKALVNLVGTLFLIIFSILTLWYSWGFVVASWRIWEVSSNANGLPLYPIKTVILVGFALLILQGISEGIKNWAIFTGQFQSREETDNA